jgi:hypothetical protein
MIEELSVKRLQLLKEVIPGIFPRGTPLVHRQSGGAAIAKELEVASAQIGLQLPAPARSGSRRLPARG